MGSHLAPGVILATFFIIGLAELPDKSFVATLILATRTRGRWVFIGAIAALAIHVVLAVTIGRALDLLPHRIIDVGSAVLFVAAAIYLFRETDSEDAEAVIAEVGAEVGRVPREARRAILRSFAVVFAGEWGDVTQIATADLTARYDAPLAVGIGAFLALVVVTALAVTAGRTLLRAIPERTIRRTAAVALLVIAVLSVVAAVRA